MPPGRGSMDSLSQVALGAAVGVAVMGRRTAVWKAAAWGAVAGTLPDLDVLIDQGDPLRNMVLHRAETHALFWLTVFSVPFAALVAWLSRSADAPTPWRRWWLALWLALVTHPLLDAMTVYGTQLALPWTDHPYGVGSVFIIDPLYTLPLLVGTGWALRARGLGRGLRANAAGLVLSTAYLAWGAAVQAHVDGVARAALAAQNIPFDRLLVTPTPFNTVLWRVVAVSADAAGATPGGSSGGPRGDHYHEGFYSLFDASERIAFDRFDRGGALAAELQQVPGAQRLMDFTKGFYKLEDDNGRIAVTDLRMGQEPTYTFGFEVARRVNGTVQALPKPVAQGRRPDVRRALAWLGQRVRGVPVAPPR